MKKFLISVAVFCAIFFVLDKIFILVRNASAGLEADKRLENIINGKIDADVIIYGSSRGARNVIASQMADSLGKKVFNLSYPGSNIEFHDYLLKETLKFNRKPKTVVLVVDGPYELPAYPTTNFRYDRLYPLVKYEPIRNTLVEKGMKNRVLMNMFVLHQLNLNNFLLYKKNFSSLDTVFSDGSMPIAAQSEKSPPHYDPQPEPYDSTRDAPVNLKSYLSFVQQCEQQGIRLVIAFPPNCSRISLPATERLESLAAGKASFMMYDTTKAVYRTAGYFYDNGHLTRAGAEIFTNELIAYLRKKGE